MDIFIKISNRYIELEFINVKLLKFFKNLSLLCNLLNYEQIYVKKAIIYLICKHT
jgi:hypothetical protein